MIDIGGCPASHDCSRTPAMTVILSHPQPQTTVCTVTGTVDWNTQPMLRHALTEAAHGGTLYVVIDLSAVAAMDAAGPYTLLEARAQHRRSGSGHLAVIIDPNCCAIPDLHQVAIRAAFDIYPTVTDALHACAHAR
jgi:anti-anti-sigma factor